MDWCNSDLAEMTSSGGNSETENICDEGVLIHVDWVWVDCLYMISVWTEVKRSLNEWVGEPDKVKSTLWLTV